MEGAKRLSMGRFFKLKYFKTDDINVHAYDNNHYGNCVLCGNFCLLHSHHVITRSKGGKGEDTVGVCPTCHNWIHAHPKLAAARGLYLNEYKNEKRITKITPY